LYRQYRPSLLSKTMIITLRYGTSGISIDYEETPGFVGVLNPVEAEALLDPQRELARSLLEPIDTKPLADIARGRKDACIVISDSTRPAPNSLMLPEILQVLEATGIPSSRILILIATGMHRSSTPQEKQALVGADIAERYRVIDHDARDRANMIEVGRIGDNVAALVNHLYVEADLKILTGFIEPHMWAGFSGGRKAIVPGISSLEMLTYVHGPDMIAHPKTDYGELTGNLFHEAALAVMKMAGADFIVNVTMNSRKEITGIFSGHPVDAHLQGCRQLAQHCIVELSKPLDFIVTTNGGAPLDCNLYQTTKGITAAAGVVKPGGDILVASECCEGVGSAEYRSILEMVDSPKHFIWRVMAKEFFILDQWCAQETYQVMLDRRVTVCTQGIDSRDLERYHFFTAGKIEQAIERLLEKHGPNARWAVVPNGPYVIVRLRK